MIVNDINMKFLDVGPPSIYHDSSRGHDFIIGGRLQGIIVMVLYSKVWRKFDAIENRVG